MFSEKALVGHFQLAFDKEVSLVAHFLNIEKNNVQ